MNLLEQLGWRVVRSEASLARRLGFVAAAMVLAVLLSAVLFQAAGASPVAAFAALFKGALGSWRSTSETLVSATPLIFTAQEGHAQGAAAVGGADGAATLSAAWKSPSDAAPSPK